jgi:hypothetical protein
LEELVILFLLAITLHNLEEALWLPTWSKYALNFHKPVRKNEFYFALIIITSIAYLSTFFYLLLPNFNIAKYILVGFLGSMIFNAIFPHLVATVVLKKYAPGVITGVLLNVPINSLILYQFLRRGELTVIELLISTLLVGFMLLSLIPILFKVGRSVTNEL